ncbi:MAG: dTDP-4-dehydrorhamnose reductase [Clostridia bacterium]|nr:dTDP-4-dehydrorhamnose reductase [Clostridia bacterium]
MKILVTGVAGQLGYDCVKQLEHLGIPCRGVDRDDFDLTDAQAVMNYVQEYKPDAIMHCAAYTNVDKAETEPQVAAAVNGMGTLNMVRAAQSVGASLMYISTDYVFDGEGDQPFEVDAPYGPTNVYGLTKMQGEEAVRSLMTKYFIIRTAWVFGMNGRNFVKTMLRLGAERSSVNVVCDQFGSPTYTPDLARLMCEMIMTNRYGVYHATNEGFCSWADFAAAIMQQGNRRCTVHPVTSEEYASATKRPANSRLSKDALERAGFSRLPSWQNALSRYIVELDENGML